ncbi:hypothetical protein D5086_024044 [Populus alba]|uniref:Uncharacterized protein n=1 Tax=Populus alba TaxID=43335 RepID=A0ACC4B520_POPAL
MIVSLRQLMARPQVMVLQKHNWGGHARSFRTVYVQSFIYKLMEPAVGQNGLKILLLGTLYYAKFNNIGQGSDTTDRVTRPGYHVVNETDAANLTMPSLIYTRGFWLPATGVPYV